MTTRKGESSPLCPPSLCWQLPSWGLCRDPGRSPLLREGDWHRGRPCAACLLWICLLRAACHKQDGRQIQCCSERDSH